MFRIVLLLAAAAVVTGRRSPHADLIDNLAKSPLGSRYSNDIYEDAQLDVPGLIQKYGYPVEVHNVITSDGYILEVHRIPYGRDKNNQPNVKRPAVFIMHGLLSSSAEFVILGPGNALAYILAEAGFDVWIGNARGNFYSRHHLTLDPDSRNLDFWMFSWDQIGNLDLKAYVDYILTITGQSKLHYIGHSQGGTSFLVLNSLRPEYNEKFASFHGLAPAAFFTNNDEPVINNLAPYERIIESLAYAVGIAEIFGDSEFLIWFRERYCEEESVLQALCSSPLLGGDESDYFNATMLPLIKGHTPAGAALRQVAHYGQSIRHNTFRRFNYGLITNLIVYGRTTPPDYDLSRITVPSYLYYGLDDKQVHFKDVALLAEKLSNTVKMIQMERETFNHFDFVWGMDARAQVYDHLVEMLHHAEGNL